MQLIFMPFKGLLLNDLYTMAVENDDKVGECAAQVLLSVFFR